MICNSPTIYDANSFDDAVSIAAVLSSYSLDFVGEVFIGNRVVKKNTAFGAWNYVSLYHLPHQSRSEFISIQIAIDSIMTNSFSVIGEVGKGVIYLSRK